MGINSDESSTNNTFIRSVIDEGAANFKFLKVYSIDDDGTVTFNNNINYDGTTYTPVGPVTEFTAAGPQGATGPQGPQGNPGATDHLLLSNIGTNSHSQLDSHLASTANPHAVTKSQVGLSNVDNTSDVNKPVSTAQAAANTQDRARANHTGTQPLSTLSQSGATTNQVATWNGSQWFPTTPSGGGVTDHAALTSIGTNTHAQIDSHLAATNNPHVVTKTQVDLGNVDNTSDANKPVSTAQAAANVTDRARANHTGTQLASTISDFAATVRNTILTGISFATSTAVTASDSILVAIGKLQAQVNGKVFGNNTQYAASEGVSSTNSNTIYSTKTTLITPVLPAGTYRIGFSFEQEINSGNQEMQAQVTHNAGVIAGFEDEPGNADAWISHAGFYQFTGSGIQTIQIQWRPKYSATCSIRRARIEFWRVS